jgi:hypothetical protein
MATAQLTLPTNEEVHLVYLRKWPHLDDMIYLQAVRSGRMREDSLAAQHYKAMARTHAGTLAELVKDNGPAFDAVVSPPSKRCDAAMYRNAIVGSPGSRDLTASARVSTPSLASLKPQAWRSMCG